MAKTYEQIRAIGTFIKNTTTAKSVTNQMVGGNIEDIADKMMSLDNGLKGYFTTIDSLLLAFPNPQIGWTAWVGATYPGTVYDVVDGNWHNTTVVPDVPAVDLSEYVSKDERMIVNVDNDYPLGSGNYDLASAIAAIPSALQKTGLTIQFKNTDGNLLSYLFNGLVANFTNTIYWELVPNEAKLSELVELFDYYKIRGYKYGGVISADTLLNEANFPINENFWFVAQTSGIYSNCLDLDGNPLIVYAPEICIFRRFYVKIEEEYTTRWSKQVFIRDMNDLNSFGYLYIGGITTSTNIETYPAWINLLFIANIAGTYNNAGGITVNSNEICYIRRNAVKQSDGSYTPVWSKQTILNDDTFYGCRYQGILSSATAPENIPNYVSLFYIANIAGTYNNAGGISISKNEISIVRRNAVKQSDGSYTPVWSKQTIAQKGDIIVAAYDASQYWKDIARYQATSIASGFDFINQGIINANNGDTVILSDGNFGNTKDSPTENNPSIIAINKSITLQGQGKDTFLSRGRTDAFDAFVNAEKVKVYVKNLSIFNAIGVNKLSNKYIDSTLILEDIYDINGNSIDVESLNFIYQNKYFSVAPYGSSWAIHACRVASGSSGDISIITSSLVTSSFIDTNTDDLKKRTILLLPGEYTSPVSIELNGSYSNRILGLEKYRDSTIINRTNTSYIYPTDVLMSTPYLSEKKQIFENITVKHLIYFAYMNNILIKNINMYGRVVNYNGDRIITIGENGLFPNLYFAHYSIQLNSNKNNRYLLKIIGFIKEFAMTTINKAGIDIIGERAEILFNGINMVGSSEYGGTDFLVFSGTDFDGTIKDITLYRTGVMKAYSIGCVSIKGIKQGRFINVIAKNLTMPGLKDDTQPNLRRDDDYNAVIDIDNGDGSYTAKVVNMFDWTLTGEEYESSSNLYNSTHPYSFQKRKLDSEMSTGWEDYDGGRRYGFYVQCEEDCDVEFYNCKGYGSPWAFNNTRGFYNNLGNAKYFNCIGYGGGIGHYCHGIISHRNSNATFVGCIGIASPFVYLTPTGIDARGSSGIKTQAGASSLHISCVGYGSDWKEGNGFSCDMNSTPQFNNCSGYSGAGEDSSGLFIAEASSPRINGGYLGINKQNIPLYYQDGTGTDLYPYRRPKRDESNLNSVIYTDHWKNWDIINDCPYRIHAITVVYGTKLAEYFGGSIRFYDIGPNSEKTEILTKPLDKISTGSYYYIQIPKGGVLIEKGHHLRAEIYDSTDTVVDYIVLEEQYKTEIIINVSPEYNSQCGAYINSYWSHDENTLFDPSDPIAYVTNQIEINNAKLESPISVRIGERADISGDYTVNLCVLKGQIIKDVNSENPNNINNCVEL